MKKNTTNLPFEEKMKTLKVKRNKSFKNNLLNSLEKEYERWFEKTSFQKQNFNLINLEIMKNITKKVLVWVAVFGVALWTLWAFNTSYANEKENLFDLWDAWYELIEDSTIWIISTVDWDTLSMKEIDNKLKEAGKKTIGDSKDPLYDLNPFQIEKLTDKEWKSIKEQQIKLYGKDFSEQTELELIDVSFEEMEFEKFDFTKENFLKGMKVDYKNIKNKLSKDVISKIDEWFKKLESTNKEEEFFKISDKMSILVENAFFEHLKEAWEIPKDSQINR